MGNDLLRWRQESSKAEWLYLAELAQTTTGYLDQLAYGFRRASPNMAKKIEKATRLFSHIKPTSKEKLVFME